MKKKMILLFSLSCVALTGVSLATVLTNGNSLSFVRATDSTVPHQIIFDESDTIYETLFMDKAGIEITKANATRSGKSFLMAVNCYGDGGYWAHTSGNLLYCETEGTSELSPNSYFEVDFSINNIASFTSVILHGTFYTNRKKTTVVDSMTVPATYDEANHKVTGKAFPFKGYVTSIELNYTCAA